MCKETSVRSAALAIVLVFLCLPLFAAGDDSPCAQTAIPGLNSLELRANAGQQATKVMPNPFKGKPGCVPTVCWLTGDQAATGWTCKEARNPKDEVKAFSIGVLEVPASSTANKDGDQGNACENGKYKPLATSVQDDTLTNSQSECLLIAYKPKGSSGQTDQAYLRVELPEDTNNEKADTTDTYVIRGVVTSGEDERYRLSLYAGAEYLYSHQNFGQAFPQLSLILETNYIDVRQRKEYCKQVPRPSQCSSDKRWPKRWFFTFRGYGDVGLMGTSALAADSTGTLGSVKVTSLSGAKVFQGHFGLGTGFTFDLAAKNADHDLSRILVLILTRIGVTSLSDVPADLKARLEALPFNDFFGVRIENAAGLYRGAYLELGFGQSNEFVHQKTKRLKVDAFVPFAGKDNLRLATRLQIDRPSPFGSLNDLAYIPGDATTTANERRGAGDVKIALLITVDIGKVFGILGVTTEPK